MQYPFARLDLFKSRLWGFALVLTAAWPMAATGATSEATGTAQAFESFAKTCATQTFAAERDRAIPRGLLGAIALAESGRWNPAGGENGENGENIAWPWTVTAKGKGNFFPTRNQAVTFVYELMADGIENIDVGCMQINLMHHADAFEDVESAFDPALNVAYGANYLMRQYASAKSWIKAAGNYHSTTPDLNRAYRDKVRKLWRSAAVLRQPRNPNSPNPPNGKFEATVQTARLDPKTFLEREEPMAVLMRPHRFGDGLNTALAPTVISPAARHIARLNQWRAEQVRTLSARHVRNFNDVIARQASLGLPTLTQPTISHHF